MDLVYNVYMEVVAKEPLQLNFKKESVNTVSRGSVRAMSEALGISETAVVHLALARLRNEMIDGGELTPLTPAQLQRIREAAPTKSGRVLSSLLP